MTSPERCSLCNSGAILDPELSNVQNAKKLGVGKDTVRRHRAHVDPYFNIPNEIITSRKTSVRLADGSWESVTYHPQALEMLEAAPRVEQVAREVFARPAPVVQRDEHVGTSTRLLQPTDLQLGKTDINGGTEETLERVRNSLAAFKADLEASPVDELIIADTGDIIENFYNTSSQAQTNDLDFSEQVDLATEVMSEIIRELAPYARKRLVYVAVPSNHCTIRVAPKSPASTPGNDVGLLVQKMIKKILADRPEYQHLEYVSPANKHLEYAVYHSDISDTTMLFAHGHHKNKAFNLGELVRDWGAAPGSEVNGVQIAFFGHFHSFHLYNSFGRWIVVGPSSDNGSSWFYNLSGQISMAGMLAMDIQSGMWYSPNIY